MKRVLVYPDAQGLADAAGARLGLLLADTVALRGRADAVLTGGTSGIAMLASLAASPLAHIIDWTSVHVWWGDERFVPSGHPDRNELQAQRALLHSIALPEENIHRMPSSDTAATPEDAAHTYQALIEAQGLNGWDVALCGVGPDGHVLSLFPGHPVFESAVLAPAHAASVVAVHDSPKPPAERISLTLASFNSARAVWLLAAGSAKADVVARAVTGDQSLPAAHVAGTEETLWLIDAEASTGL